MSFEVPGADGKSNVNGSGGNDSGSGGDDGSGGNDGGSGGDDGSGGNGCDEKDDKDDEDGGGGGWCSGDDNGADDCASKGAVADEVDVAGAAYDCFANSLSNISRAA